MHAVTPPLSLHAEPTTAEPTCVTVPSAQPQTQKPPLSEALASPAPPSVGSRARYVILRRANGSFGFELRAHNGSVILLSDADTASVAEAEAQIDLLRRQISQPDAIELRQSLTGKWYYRVIGDGRLLAMSRPFSYPSRMEKALYAARACAPGSRVTVED